MEILKNTMKILITGAAGFIGYHLIERIANEGLKIVGIDNFNYYYNVSLKYARLAESGILQNLIPNTGELITINKFPNYRILNIGNGSPQNLMDFIKAIEINLVVEAIKDYLPMQDGDVRRIWVYTKSLVALGYESKIDIEKGVSLFIKWFRNYNKINF